jgi:hypothetical protein
MVVATVLALGLGFDLLVKPPVIDETLDLPHRLVAIHPFQEARWPFDAVSSLLFVVGFGALALLASPIAALAGDDRRAGILRSAILASGLLGVASGLLYVGATQVAVAQQYCDCGFLDEEVIAQFWAVNSIQSATDWLSYGAVLFGAIAVALSAVVLAAHELPALWRWISVTAAGLLVLSVLFHELSDTPAGDLAAAVASGVLLPAWAAILAMRYGDLVAAHDTPAAGELEGSA